jgi:glycosyltransferase involved in cell wall biosynthesis
MNLLVIRSTKSLSGTETYNINLLRELNKDSSIKIRILTNLDIFSKELRNSGVISEVAHWLPVEVGTKKQLLKIILYAPVFTLLYIIRITLMQSSRRFDLVCIQSRTEMIFLTPILKLLGYKVIWIQHGPFFNSQASSLIKYLYLVVSRLVNKIIVPSFDTKLDLKKGHVDSKKIRVIRIGLDTNVYYPADIYKKAKMRKVFNLSNDSFVIGFLGTVTKEKGIDDFVNVGKLLGNVDYKYIVIGDGPEKQKMNKDISAIFTGFVLDVSRYLGMIDVFLFPTHHYEATSIAILEAQAMGISVLATDIGGNREIINHGYNGYLYKLGDVKSMARDIRALSVDSAKLRLMGEHGVKVIHNKFNIEKQAKLFAIFFKSL